MHSKSMVIGASGIVGSHIARLLSLSGEHPIGLSRNQQVMSGVYWMRGDLADPKRIAWPDVEVIYCTASARLLANALPSLDRTSLKRVVLFTTTSIATKVRSTDPQERAGLIAYAEAERDVINLCQAHGVGWTVLRPTLIYDEGKDVNVTRIALLISQLGFFPLCGRGRGLRQPVHAEDCAVAAIDAAASSKAVNKIYDLPGGETIAYREMIGRIFDAMNSPRRIVPVPPILWMAGFHLVRRRFPGITPEMGRRMAKDMVFDQTIARSDFGYSPRPFKPSFAWIR